MSPYASATLVFFLFLVYAQLIFALELLPYIFPLQCSSFSLSSLHDCLLIFRVLVQMSSWELSFITLMGTTYYLTSQTLLYHYRNFASLFILFSVVYLWVCTWVCVFLLTLNLAFNMTKILSFLFPNFLQCFGWIIPGT